MKLGVSKDRVYTDHGFTGTNRARPGLLTRRLPPFAKATPSLCPNLIALPAPFPMLAPSRMSCQCGASSCNLAQASTIPTTRWARCSSPSSPPAEFESDLIRLRTREGMAVARAKGKLRGKKPKLTERQQKELQRMYGTGEYSISDLAELFAVSRPTYRMLARQPATGQCGVGGD